MNCPRCQRQVGEDASVCPYCSADLVDVIVGRSPEPAEAVRPGRPSWLVFGGVAAAVLVVGLSAWAMVRPDAGAELANRFPAEAMFYAEIDVAEMTSEDSRRILDAFSPAIEARTGEPFDVDTAIDQLIDQLEAGLGDFDLSFEADIASWATGPVAVAGLSPAGDAMERVVVMVTGDDAAALDSFLAKWAGGMEDLGEVEVAGTTFREWATEDGTGGVVGRHGSDLILATDATAAAMVVEPAAGQTLADIPDVSAQLEALPGNAAVVFAVNGSALGEAVGDVGIAPVGWTTGAVTSERRGVRMDYVSDLQGMPTPTLSSELLGAIPSDTVAFFRVGALIDQVALLADSDAYQEMADELAGGTGVAVEDIMAVFSQDGGLAIWPSTDPELPVNAALVGVADTPQNELVDKLATLAGSMGLIPFPIEGGYSFAGLATLGTRDTVTLLTTDGELVVAPPVDSFEQGELFERAGQLVEGDLVFALDMPAVIDLIDGLVAAEDPDAAGVLRCLPLGVAAGGQTVSGSTVRHTAFVEISPRC